MFRYSSIWVSIMESRLWVSTLLRSWQERRRSNEAQVMVVLEFVHYCLTCCVCTYVLCMHVRANVWSNRVGLSTKGSWKISVTVGVVSMHVCMHECLPSCRPLLVNYSLFELLDRGCDVGCTVWQESFQQQNNTTTNDMHSTERDRESERLRETEKARDWETVFVLFVMVSFRLQISRFWLVDFSRF